MSESRGAASPRPGPTKGVVSRSPARPPAPARVGRTGFDRHITVGLVNNMPDAALLATERQFLKLLAPAGRDVDIRVRLFHLPEIERGEAARTHLLRHYAPADELPYAGIDALLVTGSEPRQPDLAEEPYWPSLARLIDWAKQNTLSALWSCLAAHAAVLHLDGVRRRRLPAKISGVYECRCVADHPLLRGAASAIRVPHSRHNGLQASDLVRSGYEILTHSDEIGVDAFVKRWPSLFVFVQGHPEYGRDTLHREYRRDMGRFLRGERDTCPELPRGYYGPEVARAMTAYAEQAAAQASPELFGRFPRVDTLPPHDLDWHASAARLFGNWLDYVAQEKQRQAGHADRPASSLIGRQLQVP